MRLSELLSVLPFYNASAELNDIEISGVETDSRNIEKGNLFICIEGFTVDGHDFIGQAADNGAYAVLTEKEVSASVPVIRVDDTSKAMAMLASKFYDYPTRQFPLIGVTGTNGKTTGTYLLESIFQQYKRKTGIMSNIQMKKEQEADSRHNTTPNEQDMIKMMRT